MESIWCILGHVYVWAILKGINSLTILGFSAVKELKALTNGVELKIESSAAY